MILAKAVAMAVKFEIEKFNKSNFSLWKLKMKAILRKDNCLSTINERSEDFKDDAKWKEMDDNAMTNLYLALVDGVLSSIEEKKSAKEISNTLTKLYEAKLLHNKIFLKRKLYTLRMAESTLVTNHINNLTLFSQLTTLGHKIQEVECAELLLQSLHNSFDQLVINLTNNVHSNYLVFEDIAAAVLEEESWRKNKEDKLTNPQHAVALTMTRGRSTKRNSSRSQNRGRSKSQNKRNFKCYNCGKKGHLKKDCWNK